MEAVERIAPQADHAAGKRERRVWRDHQIFVGGVGRAQQDLLAPGFIGFDRGFEAFAFADQGDDDTARRRFGGLLDQDHIMFQDASVDHGISLDAQGEVGAAGSGDRQRALLVFQRQDGEAGGHISQNRDLPLGILGIGP